MATQIPSGPGQTTKDKSMSVTFASDDPAFAGLQRLIPLGPGPGSNTPSASKIFGVAFTANQNVNANLASATYEGLKTAIDAGKAVMLKATAGCYYNWHTGPNSINAASTASSNPGTQGIPIFDGGESLERPPAGTTYLNILGGAVAGTLYVYLAE